MPRISQNTPVPARAFNAVETPPAVFPRGETPAAPAANDDRMDILERRTDISPALSRGPVAPSVSSSDPQVSAILSRYGIEESLGRPRERIVSWVAKVQEKLLNADLQADTPAALTEHLLKKRLRLQVFYLQGILKLYRKRYPGAAEAEYQKVKALEDALGKASGARSVLALAEKHDALPASALTWLQDEVTRNDKALLDLFRDQWTPDANGCLPALASVLSFLQDTSWDGYKEDRKYLQKEIGRRLKKFSKVKFDMEILQGDIGIHELRRQLRWFPIYTVAVDGLISLDATRNPIADYCSLLQNEDLVNSKYARVPSSSREENPLGFSHSLYLRNCQLIGELGGLKDEGEEIEAVAFALEGAHLVHDPKRAFAKAKEIMGLPEDGDRHVFTQAQAIWQEMQDTRYIKAMRDEVREK